MFPVLYTTWAYQVGGPKLTAKRLGYYEMACNLSAVYKKRFRKITLFSPMRVGSFIRGPINKSITPMTTFIPTS